jgi:hypothetical protein
MYSQLPFLSGGIFFICNLMTLHVVITSRVGERTDAYSVWWGKLWERDHCIDPGVDGRIILEWMFIGSLNAVMNFRAPEYVANFFTI